MYVQEQYSYFSHGNLPEFMSISQQQMFTKSPLGINLLTSEIKISKEQSGVIFNRLLESGQPLPLSGWGLGRSLGGWWRVAGLGVGAGCWRGEGEGGLCGFLPTGVSSVPGKVFLSSGPALSAAQEGCCLLHTSQNWVMAVGRQHSRQGDIRIAQILNSCGHTTGPMAVSLVSYLGGLWGKQWIKKE